MHDLVLNEFQRSGISQADLARRLGKSPAVISRMLGAPGNWGLDMVSDLLFGISGAEPVYGIRYPLDEPTRNYIWPEWLDAPPQIFSNPQTQTKNLFPIDDAA